MAYEIFNWMISVATFGPFFIGVPLLALLILLDEYSSSSRPRWP